jgi:hypothetical protein
MSAKCSMPNPAARSRSRRHPCPSTPARWAMGRCHGLLSRSGRLGPRRPGRLGAAGLDHPQEDAVEIDADAAPWAKRLETWIGAEATSGRRALHFVGPLSSTSAPCRQDQVGNDGPAPDCAPSVSRLSGASECRRKILDRPSKPPFSARCGTVDPEQVDPSASSFRITSDRVRAGPERADDLDFGGVAHGPT